MNAPLDDYPRPFATIDLVMFALDADGLDVLLVRREAPPFEGGLALPGGFVHVQEDADLESAARRVLRDKTGVETPYLEQLMTFGGARRDPRGWALSVAYFALLSRDVAECAARSGLWRRLEGERVVEALAFDHADILAAAVRRLRDKVAYSTLPAHLLPPRFTLTDLQTVYEQLLGRGLDKSAFRKRMAELDFVEAIEGEQRRGSNRPAQLYRLRQSHAVTLMDRTI